MSFTQKQIAEMLGCTDRQLRNYRKEGMPLDTDDILCVKKCAIWIHENTNPHAGGWNTRKEGEETESSINLRIKEATLRKLEEEAREKRLRNEETEKRLYDASAVEQRITEWAVKMRSWVKSLPTKLLPYIPDAKGEVKAKLEREIRQGLRLVHGEGPEVDSDD